MSYNSNKIKNVRSLPTSHTFKDVVKHIDREEFAIPFDNIMDQLFGNIYPELQKEVGVGIYEKQSYPKVDIIEYVDTVEIIAEIPGISKENVNVEIVDNMLSISGKKHERVSATPDKECKVIRRELKQSNFKRSFALGDQIDQEKLTAKFEDGMLKIVLHKIQKDVPKVRKIEVQ
jgi:HSP20 family protein